MKQFLIIMFSLWSFSLVAQTESYMHEYKSGKSILTYSYIQRNDSTFMYGHLKDRKTGAPILNINILVKDFRIGTVTDLGGDFTLFLPRQEGTIIFDKAGYIFFEFPYKYKSEYFRKHSAHH